LDPSKVAMSSHHFVKSCFEAGLEATEKLAEVGGKCSVVTSIACAHNCATALTHIPIFLDKRTIQQERVMEGQK
jgi:hypothetical protein